MSFAAFISYSHGEDRALAAALQSALHRFAKPWYRLRAVRVFRDATNLTAAHSLPQVIQGALDASRQLVLLASEQAARSPWCRAEIDHWLATRSAETILIVLTQGEIAWDAAARDFDWARTTALPRGLAGAFAAEPLYLDLRWAKTAEHFSQRDPRFLDAVARISAALRGLSLDEIAGEEVRQHRRTRRTALAAASAIAALVAAAGTAGLVAYERSVVARRTLQSALNAADTIVIDIAQELRGLAGVSTPRIKAILERAEGVLEELRRVEPTDAVLQSRAALLNAFAGVHLTLGDLKEAAARAAEAEAILKGLLARDPGNARWLLELSVAEERQGDIAFERGDGAEARARYRAVLELRERLVARAPADAQRLRRLIHAYHDAADAEERLGDGAAALAGHSAGLERSRRLLALAPADPQARFEVANSQSRLCGLAFRQARHDAARAACLESRRLLAELVREHAGKIEYRQELSRSHYALARLELAAADLAAAAREIALALAASRELRELDPRNTEYLRDRALMLARQAEIALAGKDTAAALAALEEERQLWELLLGIDAGNMTWQRDAARCALRHGQALAQAGRTEEARAALERARAGFRMVLAKMVASRSLQREIDAVEAALAGLGGGAQQAR